MSVDDDSFSFAEDDPEVEAPSTAIPWNILVVDDEPDVHNVTRMVMKDVLIAGRPLNITSAYTGMEARAIVEADHTIALMLLDAMMENETAGIDCARYIKETLRRKIPIIVMRTGHAGPEIEAMLDNNPYLDAFLFKTQSTRQKLIETFTEWLK